MFHKKRGILVFIALMILSIGLIVMIQTKGVNTYDKGLVKTNNREFDVSLRDESNLIFMLSNQSKLSTVNIRVFLDGEEIIAQECKAENHHKGYYFYLTLEGQHEVRIMTDDGLELSQSILLEANVKQWHSILIFENIEYIIQDEEFLWS